MRKKLTSINEEDQLQVPEPDNTYDPMQDIKYILSLTDIVTDKAFTEGKDVAQLSNGDIVITETKVIHIHDYHIWDRSAGKFIVKRGI